MANKLYDSAGVYMSEKDLTFSTEVIGVTTLGLIGETMKGPAMQPIFIKNYDDFKVMFGGTNPTKYKGTQIPKYELAYIAKSYLSQTNQLYVTRVLGLSGYNAGNAYVLRTTGSVDIGTLTGDTVNIASINFALGTGSTTNFVVAGGTTPLITQMAINLGVDEDKLSKVFGTYFNPVSGAVNTYQGTAGKTNGVYWGLLTDTEQDAFDTITTGGHQIDGYDVGTSIMSTTNHWLLNEFNLVGDTYTGMGFYFYVEPMVDTVHMVKINYTGAPHEEYHNKLVATLRSRGRVTADKLEHFVASDIALDDTTEISTNPYGTFRITGNTVNADAFDYTLSLDPSSNNYIKRVLGVSAVDKEPFLFVEDLYLTMLKEGFNNRKVQGLRPDVAVVTGWDNYRTKFQTPVTPFFVSELRGGIPQKLFRLISISDGNTANTEIKVSIANISLDTKTFDVYIRAFNDVDRNAVLVERFLNCDMNPSSNDFIGRKIGTSDNMFDLRSAFVMVELDEYAPTTAVPAGFEGFQYRTDANVGVPVISYKTKYYKAGETVYTRPDGTPVISSGDKVRKNYLGFSDTIGIDADLTKFKGITPSTNWDDGLEWGGHTKGFHMDIDAANIVNVDNETVFDVGTDTFASASEVAKNTNDYNDIRSRKFTCILAGGFDGWDVYRDRRTNTDPYKIGRSGFEDGEFEVFSVQGQEDDYGTSDYYAYQLGIQSQENPEDININIMATPGIDIFNNTDLVRDALEIIEEKRRDSIYLPTLPDIRLLNNFQASNTDDWYYPRDVVMELESKEFDSSYAAVFYPWYQIYDAENNTNLFISPTVDVVRNLALTDNIAHPWYATAGYKRGLVNAKRTRIKLTQDYRDILYKGRINPLATFTDIGVAIWGNRNLQVANSALNRLNIRRLLLQTKKLIGQVGNRLLFDPNDDTIRTDFLAAVNPILDNIRKQRGLVDFRIKLENSADGDDRNTLRGKIFLKPTPALEVIDLEFTVTPTNVSFDSF